jgi:acetyl esterase/lipase
MHVVARPHAETTGRHWFAKALLALAVIAALLLGSLWVAVRISPWPMALLTRVVFTRGARVAYHRLEKHLPAKTYEQRDQHYDDSNGDAYLDVYSPQPFDSGARPATTVVWVHGGAWLSGGKNDIANYARILAARGFTVVSLDYSLSPTNLYPTPVLQVNTALGYLVANAERLHVDPSRIFLAGDSAGAQIAAQVAAAVTSEEYAGSMEIHPTIRQDQLKGVLLYCGVYDIDSMRFDGAMGFLMKEALRSYMGTRNYPAVANFAEASVANYVTPKFPPAFISAGNSDPVEPQSHKMAQALQQKGVTVETLFYPPSFQPPLAHEYQFDLDLMEGRDALDRSVAFLEKHGVAASEAEPASALP